MSAALSYEWPDEVDDAARERAATSAHFMAAVLLNVAGRRFTVAKNRARDAEIALGHAVDRVEAALAELNQKSDEVERAARLYAEARAGR